MKKQPIALQAYETLAERYAAQVDTKPHNAFYERPATLSLLPDVRGKHILDAGCGPGAYSEWLIDHGADVVALDASPKMVQLARKRLNDRIPVHQAELNQTLDFLQDSSFDIVLSALVMDYIKDWARLFREFHRILRVHGYLIFSAGHPFADFALPGAKNYFDTELLEIEWKGFGIPVVMPFYRRPLNALVNPLLESGFALDRILEPTPIEEFREKDPEEYEKLSRQPGFLCIRAMKQ